MEERKKNPVKQTAMYLAHQLDDEQSLREGFVSPERAKEIRACGNQLRDEILKNGYNVGTIMYYVKQYKSLSMSEYFEWIYV